MIPRISKLRGTYRLSDVVTDADQLVAIARFCVGLGTREAHVGGRCRCYGRWQSWELLSTRFRVVSDRSTQPDFKS